ncbi:hypothetical protein SeLEV6574_g02627 [Synchytrium endobioticum]|uniref:Glucanase n=1 Tax=Synchytrium endobioticum TaxID=286115 RepID=A0A507D7R4_9FUNG|nr:hypothetical protein SeLEV6574_g02627 [Synchytrium endobioticum]
MHLVIALVASLVVFAYGQNATEKLEIHPKVGLQKCAKGGTCKSVNASVVLDAIWNWSSNPAGADYLKTAGVMSNMSALTQKYVVKRPDGTSGVGSRLYIMSNDMTYYQFPLLNQEFTFTIDASAVPCGVNSALYLVSMNADGTGNNRDGTGLLTNANGGQGYCDGAGVGGFWCPEMDIWEGNSVSSTMTPHVCDPTANATCDGCHHNPYRLGEKNFFGVGKTVDTKFPFTVVTQFITNDGTDKGFLTEIRRKYVQNGKVIPNKQTMDEAFCAKAGGGNFTKIGGLKAMTEPLRKAMVATIAFWDDKNGQMEWLDGVGAGAGPCTKAESEPMTIQATYPDAQVVFTDFKYGDLDSTYPAGTQVTPIPIGTSQPRPARSSF